MSQVLDMYALLSDYKPHSTKEILKEVYGSSHLGIARIGARIYDIKDRFRVQIKSWQDPVRKTIWWYQMEKKIVPTSTKRLSAKKLVRA